MIDDIEKISTEEVEENEDGEFDEEDELEPTDYFDPDDTDLETANAEVAEIIKELDAEAALLCK